MFFLHWPFSSFSSFHFRFIVVGRCRGARRIKSYYHIKAKGVVNITINSNANFFFHVLRCTKSNVNMCDISSAVLELNPFQQECFVSA